VIDVALAADTAYIPHAATTLHSLLTSNDPTTVRAHLLHPPDLSRKVITVMERMVTGSGGAIRFHQIGRADVQGLPSMGRISQVMWYRLLLPELLPIERVLYLDCDTLVVDDVSSLWTLDMGSQPIAAVTNVFPHDLIHRPGELGIPIDRYFNSGVLLMDLDVWRRTDCAAAVVHLARHHPDRLVFPDQDALNIVLSEKRVPLHPRWNAQNSIFYFSWAEERFSAATIAEARSNPAIVHFEGPAQAKPWHRRSTHPYQPTYLEHRAHTPWPRVRLEGSGVRDRLRRRLTVRPR
jgi:lipopolysaccharide biosynthesis glycosyltransferase